MKKVLIWLGLVAVAFLAGFVPQYLKVQEAEQGRQESEERCQALLAELREQNRALQLQRQLGMLLLEAQEGNFGLARERSTKLFDDVAGAISETNDAKLKAGLTSIAKHRDETTAGLTAASPEVVSQIRQMYQELATASGIP